MSVRLSDDEAWDYLAASITGIMTTLRSDGCPVSLPVWFVVIEREIFLRTPSGSKKVARVRNDPRAAFLVEGGERWSELKAVSLTGRASVVQDPDLHARAAGLLREKYQPRRARRASLPENTARHYATGEAVVRFVPDSRLLSWDNSRVDVAPRYLKS